MSMSVSKNFSLASYGLIFGGVSLAQNSGAAIGPLAAGYIYDITASYQMAFMLFMALFILSIPAILAIKSVRTKLKLGYAAV